MEKSSSDLQSSIERGVRALLLVQGTNLTCGTFIEDWARHVSNPTNRFVILTQKLNVRVWHDRNVFVIVEMQPIK